MKSARKKLNFIIIEKLNMQIIHTEKYKNESKNEYRNVIQYILQCALRGQSSCELNMTTNRYSYCPETKSFIGPIKMVPDMPAVIAELRKVIKCKLIYDSFEGKIFVYFV